MNAKQALKKASERIQNMEHTLFCNKVDIKAYNECIMAQIDGKSPCPWCHDYEECEKEEKNGCSEWMLRMPKFTAEEVKEAEDASERLHVEGAEGGEGTPPDQRKEEALRRPGDVDRGENEGGGSLQQ
ncbi:MAG: hypothetical protein J6U66_10105 [Lachnospiraceae bacterium]|nr:hypothetical protein [Lachnospiraceae bacterium]